jgi:2-polyprenyl-3-methyl-5-hydroxy-6-metoxy-1,4-benzoquinol methylase
VSESTGPAGNVYDKYGTRNPVARLIMGGFLHAFDRLVSRVPPNDALEVGCGEGELSIRLSQRGFMVQACDIDAGIVAEARRRAHAAGAPISFFAADLLKQGEMTGASTECIPSGPFPLVICCEVLEHVPDPEAGLDALARLTAGHLLASVPREPLWRCLNVARGRYLRDWGNTPGHVNHWNRRQFLDLLRTRFDVIETAAPVPWTMALCRPR